MKTLKDINWNQVYCFFEVARKLSMKEASAILGVSTPTVSEQIKRLENLLGVTLFTRHARRIELTEEGENLYTCAREMFEIGSRFLDTVTTDSIGGYSARVGIVENSSTPLAIEFVNQYWDIFAPFGTVNTAREVLAESLVEKILAGNYDWGISTSTASSTRLGHAQIAQSELVFCIAPRLLGRFQHKEDILRTIPLARSSWDESINEIVFDTLRAADVHPDEVMESDHPQYIMELARRGRCVGVVPRQFMATPPWRDVLTTFALPTPMMVKIYALWRLGSERMISIKKLIELIEMSGKPQEMLDPDLQIKVSDVSDDLLEPRL